MTKAFSSDVDGFGIVVVESRHIDPPKLESAMWFVVRGRALPKFWNLRNREELHERPSSIGIKQFLVWKEYICMKKVKLYL